MSLSPLALSLVEAGAALARDDGAAFIAALKAHNWKSVAVEVVFAELKLAAAAGLPGAAIALKLVPLASFLFQHPADPSSPAMAKAAGGDGGQNIAAGG